MFSRAQNRLFHPRRANSFATVYYFYYLYFFMQQRFGFGNQANLMLARSRRVYMLAAFWEAALANGADISRAQDRFLGHGRILQWMVAVRSQDRSWQWRAWSWACASFANARSSHQRRRTRAGCSTWSAFTTSSGQHSGCRFFTVARCSKSWACKAVLYPLAILISQLG